MKSHAKFYNDPVNIINSIIHSAEKNQIVHIPIKEDLQNDQFIQTDEKLLNFGICSYLNLHRNKKLIKLNNLFANRYGTQFSVSRAYLKSEKLLELESLISRMFDNSKVLTYSSTTLAHISLLPIVIEENSMLVVDQQVHVSIQGNLGLINKPGIEIKTIKHNNLNMLELLLSKHASNTNQIWYLLDGIYSMFGDYVDFEKLNELQSKYKNLYLYADDAHGMSWTGKNGCGFLFEKIVQKNRLVLVSTLSKGFGSSGGIAIFNDNELYNKINTHGGPLSYSHPLSPPVVGSAIASAKIHLSNEITDLQEELQNNINYCNQLLSKTELPILSNENSPIKFIGTGSQSFGFKINERLIKAGIYVNIAVYPAVAKKNTGIRFTINRLHKKEDILHLVNTIEFIYKSELLSSNEQLSTIRKKFRISAPETQSNLTLISFDSVKMFDKTIWDKFYQNEANLNFDSLRILEDSYSNNKEKEDNWKFKYFQVNNYNKTILNAITTICYTKEDFNVDAWLAKKIENIRNSSDKYYLTNKSLIIGTMFTVGNHCVALENSEAAYKIFIEEILKYAKSNSVDNIFFRDIYNLNSCIAKILESYGFIKVQMPNNNVIELKRNHLLSLSKKAKRNIKNEVLKNINEIEIKHTTYLNDEQLKLVYQLYLNVKRKNLYINYFDYNYKMFQNLNKSENWEFLLIYKDSKLLAFGLSHNFKDQYNPTLLGIDYDYNIKYKLYKTLMYTFLTRGISLKKTSIHLGITNDFEKKKLGATQKKMYNFVYCLENFNTIALQNLSSQCKY